MQQLYERCVWAREDFPIKFVTLYCNVSHSCEYFQIKRQSKIENLYNKL